MRAAPSEARLWNWSRKIDRVRYQAFARKDACGPRKAPAIGFEHVMYNTRIRDVVRNLEANEVWWSPRASNP